MKKLIRIMIVLCLLGSAGVYAHVHRMDPYKVRRIDVSHYQGKIRWDIIKEQQVEFAFIKATEGSSHVDECYEYNRKEAMKQGIRTGAL